MRNLSPLLALALLGPAPPQAEVVLTPHYRVVSTQRQARFVREVAGRLEAGHSERARLLGLTPEQPTRYTLHLHATHEEYAARDRELMGERFEDNGGFSHRRSGEAHIRVAPRPGVPCFERFCALLHHEAFHLLTFRHAVWLDEAPAWLKEGMCERATEVSMKDGKADPLVATVHFGSRARLVQTLLARHSWIPLAELIARDGSSNSDWLMRWLWYAESWLLVKYLAGNDAVRWQKFLAAQRALDGRQRGAARTRSLLLQATGVSLAKLEAGWIEWIRGLATSPWIVHDGDWRLTEAGLEGASMPDRSGAVFHHEPVRSRRHTLSAEAKLEEEGSEQVDLVFAPAWDVRGDNQVKLALVRPGTAVVLVRKERQWTKVASRVLESPMPRADRWMRLDVEVAGKAVKLRLDGRLAIAHTFDDPDVELESILWGVGCYDSWVQFRNLVYATR